jgi:hypothetical protein
MYRRAGNPEGGTPATSSAHVEPIQSLSYPSFAVTEALDICTVFCGRGHEGL